MEAGVDAVAVAGAVAGAVVGESEVGAASAERSERPERPEPARSNMLESAGIPISTSLGWWDGRTRDGHEGEEGEGVMWRAESGRGEGKGMRGQGEGG